MADLFYKMADLSGFITFYVINGSGLLSRVFLFTELNFKNDMFISIIIQKPLRLQWLCSCQLNHLTLSNIHTITERIYHSFQTKTKTFAERLHACAIGLLCSTSAAVFDHLIDLNNLNNL